MACNIQSARARRTRYPPRSRSLRLNRHIVEASTAAKLVAIVRAADGVLVTEAKRLATLRELVADPEVQRWVSAVIKDKKE